METPDRPVRRFVLRAALKEVSPIVARVISVPDSLKIQQFHELFLAMLDWRGDPDFILRVRGQTFASFRRRYRDTRLDDFRLRAQEKFVYVCDTLDLWEWEIRVLDTEPLSAADDPAPRCLKGRGAAPPELCGGPVGYRLMLRRQLAGPAIADPSTAATTVGLLAAAYGDEFDKLDLATLEETLTEGWKSVETRLERTGELAPTRFSLEGTNERLAAWWRCRGELPWNFVSR